LTSLPDPEADSPPKIIVENVEDKDETPEPMDSNSPF